MSNKVILIGDTHFGEKGNSLKYNQQLVDFFHWVVDFAESNDITKAVHMGDYYHNRNTINVETINYGIEGAKVLSNYFKPENLYVLTGNHDIYYKDTLEVNSLKIIEPYVTIIDDVSSFRSLKGMVLTPWVCNSVQWEALVEFVQRMDPKFICGHFEFNGFEVSAGHVMDHGLSHKELITKSTQMIYSGHYHSPQKNGKVNYIGTPIATTMSEANEAHGITVLDLDTGEEGFIAYTAVKTVSIAFFQLDDILPSLDPKNTSIRVEFPDDLEDEMLIEEVQTKLAEMQFEEVKIKYTGNKVKELLESVVDAELESVDNIDTVVINFIRSSADVSGVDKQSLEALYKLAMEKGTE